MSRVTSILCIGVVAAVVALGGCLSPTLPLPPPEPPSASAGTTPGMVHLEGHAAEANALILIVNTNTALPNDEKVGGTFADANGAWDANVWASNGDQLHISQQFGQQSSAYITYTVNLP